MVPTVPGRWRSAWPTHSRPCIRKLYARQRLFRQGVVRWCESRLRVRLGLTQQLLFCWSSSQRLPAILDDFSTPSLAQAIEDNAVDCCLSWARWPGMQLGTDPYTVWTLTDVPFPFFNNALQANISEADVGHAIEAAIARARERRVPFFWLTGPTTRPDDLGQHLLARVFAHGFEAAAMAVDLPALNEDVVAPSQLVIEEVNDAEKLAAWRAVMTSVYEFPPFAAQTWFDILTGLGLGPDQSFRHFLTWLDGTPVATASLFLGAGVAGISSVTTLSAYRRQGIAAAITRESLRHARQLGYRLGVLFSSPAGVSIYHKLGFREYGKGNCYVWSAGSKEGYAP